MPQFIAATGLKNPHAQTLFPRMIRKKALFEPQWQTLDTPDGDFLDLAWSEDPQSNKVKKNRCLCCFMASKGVFIAPTQTA
ncbi:hydrolase alpha/beta fold family functionally coupled to phosphoribulokinase [Vibrio astriarenae]|nr:hydrolase alpha/beta fold family functionally coupled to phosphoribulokinase [Vibrio sp. C7]